MKKLITLPAIVFSMVLYAQAGTRPDTMHHNYPTQANAAPSTNPAIAITPATNTVIIPQPASLPVSNTNPVTGTVINLKQNKKTNAVPVTTPVTTKTKKAAVVKKTIVHKPLKKVSKNNH